MANTKKSAAPKKAAGKRTEPGNVVLDFGEQLDGVIDHAVKAGYRRTGLGSPGRIGAPGWRPGIFASGFRPGVHRSKLGATLSLPATVDPLQLFGGTVAGTAANRVLRRALPYLIKSLTSSMLVDGINAALGVVPFLFRKNAFTVGFAIPGILNLAGTLVDKVLDATKVLPAPALSGATLAGPTLADAQARLSALRQRMESAKTVPFPQQSAQTVPAKRVAVA